MKTATPARLSPGRKSTDLAHAAPKPRKRRLAPKRLTVTATKNPSLQPPAASTPKRKAGCKPATIARVKPAGPVGPKEAKLAREHLNASIIGHIRDLQVHVGTTPALREYLAAVESAFAAVLIGFNPAGKPPIRTFNGVTLTKKAACALNEFSQLCNTPPEVVLAFIGGYQIEHFMREPDEEG